MRVLVTGGAGYIGSHVVRALQGAGHEVVVIDDLSTGHRLLAERNGVELVVGDLANAQLLDQVFLVHEPEAVVHIAGRALVGESVDDPSCYFGVNTVAGWQLLEAMRRHRVRRIVFSSTCAVYGVPDEIPISERCPREPANPYGASKLAFEQMLGAYARAYGLKALALRYFNVAGASRDGDLGELHEPETHLVPNLLRAARNGNVFRLFGANYPTRDGSALRDYLHVEDLARAHVRAVERLGILDPLAFGGALNLGSGQGYTVREVLEVVERALDCEIHVQEQPRRAGDPPALLADPNLARKIIGFTAQLDLGSMVRSAHRFEEAEAARRGVPVNSSLTPGGTMSPTAQRKRLRFGEAIVAAGYIEPDTVRRALEIQRERDSNGESHKLLGLILLEMGAISNSQLIETLKRMQKQRAPA